MVFDLKGMRFTRVCYSAGITIIVLMISTFAFADTSLRMGTTFPGWDKLRSTGAEGRLNDAIVDIARGYARQLGKFCSLPEAFLRDRSSSIQSALVFYSTYLPYGAREEVLLNSREQRVSIVSKSYGGDVLVVLIDLDDLGIGMVICGI